MADETIVTEFIVEVAQAITKINDINSASAKAKEQLRVLANETKKSYQELAKILSESAKASKDAFKQTGPKDTWDSTKLEKYNEAAKQLPITLAGIKQATAELLAEQATEAEQLKQLDSIQRAINKEMVAETQQAMNTQRQQIKDRIALENELQEKIQQRAQVEAQSSVYESKLSQGRSPQQAINALAVYNAELQKGVKMSTAYAIAQQKVSKDLVGVDKELRQKPKDIGGFQGALQKLGSVGQFVFGTVLGITAIGAFNALRTAFTTLIADGEKFLSTLFKFQVSVRNLQRRGIDITFKEAAAQVKNLRKEFGIFSDQEAMAAVANVQLLTANFQFSTEQMYKMTEAAAALAIITGEDLDEASRKLALFLSSGYSEGLQRAGLAINKLTVSQKAYAMGLIDTKFAYAQLTEVQRAHVAELVIEEQISTLLVESQNVLETNYGKIRKAEADLKTETDKLALSVVPLKKTWLDFQLTLMKGFQALRQVFAIIAISFDKYLVVPFVAGIETIAYFWTALVNGIRLGGKDLIDNFNKVYEQLLKLRTDKNLEKFAVTYDPFAGGVDLSEEERARAKKAADDAAAAEQEIADYENRLDIMKQFYDVKQQYEEKDAEIWKDYYDKLEEIAQEELEKTAEIWQDYYDKIEEINRKLAQAIEDENRNYQQDLQDLDRETQQKLEDAARKYRYDQLRAEREFQEKMRRLREEFLFDLEDALRERDALAVLRLIRRYRLDVEQTKRQYELERQERLEAYRQEIEDIKRQAERKREELALEHQRKLEDLQRQAEEERQKAAEDRQRALDELTADMDKEREDAKAKRDEQLADLKTWLQDQLTELLTKYGEMDNVTTLMMDQMAKLFADTMGKNGLIDLTVTEFQGILARAIADARARLAELQAIAQQVAQLSEQLNRDPNKENTPSEGGEGNPAPKSAGGHAGFGRYTLGERGEEFVIKADVLKTLERGMGRLTQSKLLSLLNQSPNMRVTMLSPKDSGKGSTEHSVKISLSEGLIGEIMDQTMDETSKIYLTSSRERR